jgi:hypothetical protein
MVFTPDHCRKLATSRTKTNIALYSCQFEDEGSLIVGSSATRQDETSGPAKLRIFGQKLGFVSQPAQARVLDSILLCVNLESTQVSGIKQISRPLPYRKPYQATSKDLSSKDLSSKDLSSESRSRTGTWYKRHKRHDRQVETRSRTTQKARPKSKPETSHSQVL